MGINVCAQGHDNYAKYFDYSEIIIVFLLGICQGVRVLKWKILIEKDFWGLAKLPNYKARKSFLS